MSIICGVLTWFRDYEIKRKEVLKAKIEEKSEYRKPFS